MGLLRRLAGMVRVIVHLGRGALILAFVFPFLSADRQRYAIQRWARGVLRIFGLGLQVDGSPQGGGPLLLVGNHVSWVDIYAYLAVVDARFVAKSEVRSWPVIGWFASRLGTIFVDRDRPRDAVRVGQAIADGLRDGASIVVFPEGTTSDGTRVLPFSPVLFAPACDLGVPVQPVAIRYEGAGGLRCLRTSFVDDKTLVGSLWDLAGGGQSTIRLSFLEPISADSDGRRGMASAAERGIRSRLDELDATAAWAGGETGPALAQI